MSDRDARLAGFLYLVAVGIGIFDLDYVPGRIGVPGDAAATAHNIVVYEGLFRLGIAGDIVCGAFWTLIPLALYQLLKDVDRTQANLMVIFGAFLQSPLYFVMAAFNSAALLFAANTEFLRVFSAPQRDAMAMLMLKLRAFEFDSSLMLAGIWLVPLGVLIYKSRVFPRFLGIWLIVNGLAWIAVCLTGFVAPQYDDIVNKITSPILFGEMAIALWLLIFGTRRIVQPKAA